MASGRMVSRESTDGGTCPTSSSEKNHQAIVSKLSQHVLEVALGQATTVRGKRKGRFFVGGSGRRGNGLAAATNGSNLIDGRESVSRVPEATVELALPPRLPLGKIIVGEFVASGLERPVAARKTEKLVVVDGLPVGNQRAELGLRALRRAPGGGSGGRSARARGSDRGRSRVRRDVGDVASRGRSPASNGRRGRRRDVSGHVCTSATA